MKRGYNYVFKEKYKKVSFLLSFLLITELCMTTLKGFSDNNAENILKEEISLPEITLLKEDQIPEVIDYEIVEKNGHILRRYDLEKDLNTIVFQNSEGDNTAYVFSENVKYVDINGNVRDKNTNISDSLIKNEYKENYAFVNENNDVHTYFPKSLSNNNGILMEYKNIKIELTPIKAEKKYFVDTLAKVSKPIRKNKKQK